MAITKPPSVVPFSIDSAHRLGRQKKSPFAKPKFFDPTERLESKKRQQAIRTEAAHRKFLAETAKETAPEGRLPDFA